MTQEDPHTDSQPPVDFDEVMEVAEKLQPAFNKLTVLFQRLSEGSSLTTSQVSIMNRLREHGPSRISAIAAAEHIRMPTTSNALYQLERRGFVHRTRDSADRRGVLVALTDEGQKELETVSRERSCALAEILRWLGPDGLKTAAGVEPVINQLAEIYQPSEGFGAPPPKHQ